ncbi:MAG: monooxygenase, FAD-binding protein [Tardiphaga sp.]|jgi:hypothetical protein|nr:monooxygenase, FAD-binding protein [Tardiphaga sp.]
MMPNRQRMTGDFEVLGPVKIRPADLYVIEGHRQAGIVVIGDAFATSCPAEGMAVEKNADFYDDRIKTASDAWSTAKAYHLKSLTLDNSPYWRAQRWTRFLVRLTQAASHAAPTHQRPPWGHTARS